MVAWETLFSTRCLRPWAWAIPRTLLRPPPNLNTFKYTNPFATSRITVGSAAVSNFQEITWQDIVDDQLDDGTSASLRVSMPTGNTVTMAAVFAPEVKVNGVQIPIDLKVAAGLLGVDHFNWIQRVTPPSGGSPDFTGLSISRVGPNAGSPAVAVPLVDPIDSPTDSYVLKSLYGTRAFLATDAIPGNNPPQRAAPDDLPFYFNEDCKTNTACGTLDPAAWTSAGSLLFRDSPWTAYGLYPNPAAPATLRFTTELIGVNKDGTYVDTPFHFSWKSNTVRENEDGPNIAGGATYLSGFSVLDTSGLPNYISGGVFDVQASDVPEPTTFVMVIFAATVCYVWREAGRIEKAQQLVET